MAMQRLLAWAAGAVLVLHASMAAAQNYPSRPIRFVVGPGPDLLARIVGEKLTQLWGQPVVVDQRPAAGGIVAGDTVAKANPDGYTMLLSTGSYTINSVLQPDASYDFQRDLTPVTLMATLPFVLVVNPSVPATSLQELVALAHKEPGKLNCASSGNGTPAHLAFEMLKLMAKIDAVHVPYKSATAAVTDVVSGQVQMMFVPAPSAIPFLKTGQLRAIAVSGPKRYKSLPDVPTVAEQGYPKFSVVGWNGVHMPAKTPPALLQKVSRELAEIMHRPDVQASAEAAGFEPVGSTQEEFAAFAKQDTDQAAATIKAGNIHAN